MRPNSRVMKILSNDKGQVTGVQYLDDKGQLQEQPAGVVILSSYIYENNRLLLLSTSGFYKNGLANNAGNVGKHYMSHVYVGEYGFFPDTDSISFRGRNGQATAMDDLNGDNFDHTGLGFIRGGVVFASNGNLPISSSRTLPPDTPAWGSAYKKFIHDYGDSSAQLFAQVEPLP